MDGGGLTVTHADAGRMGGRQSGLARLKKGREALWGCRTVGELVRVVQGLERKAWLRGYQSGHRRGRRVGFAEALGETRRTAGRAA